jgi:ABC-type antimicrobial peptide transport system permease subunit
MNSLTLFAKKLSLLLARKRFRGELDEELAFHRAQAEKEFEAGGMTREAARHAAARRLGNVPRLKEQSHEVVAFRVETVVQDLRFALRQMRRSPGFAITAMLILALGMGASMAIFGFVDAALLQPLPYAQPNRLMSVDESGALFPRSNLSYDDYQDWKRLNKSFSQIDVYSGTGYLLGTASGAVPVPGARVSDLFFSTLGVKAMLGRTFLPGEDRPGKPKIVMLSYGTWLKRFGGRSDVIGQAVSLSGESYTIVGVVARDFVFAPRGNAELWAPLLDKNGCEQRRSCHNLDGIGRLRDGLTDGDRSAAGRLWRRMGANLVVVELAVAVVLLMGAGLLAQSFYKLLHVDNGFDTTHLATVQVMAPDKIYTKDAQQVALYREIERRMSALPGVQSVGITSDLPVQCNCDTDWIRFVGKPFHGEHNEVLERDVSQGYLATLKARLVRGRLFTNDDDASKPRVLIINEALARKYFPGEDPIGKLIGDLSLTPGSMRQIIGVVADVREGTLDTDAWPAEYEDINQGPQNRFAVAVRTAQDERSVLPEMVKTLRQIDPNLGVYGEITMEDQIDASQTALLHRIATWLVGGFAVMALVLSVVGLYGVISYSVSRRTREIGVRTALGAQRGAVYRLVMSEAGRLTLVGVGVGLVCSVGTSLLMRKLLFGVQAWDAATLAGVVVVLGGASMAASFLPAHRAASVNPTDALRAE